MAPTQGELVHKLTESVSTLFARTEHIDQDLRRVDAAHGKTSDVVQDLAAKFAAVEERLNELKEVVKESGRRRFSLWQGVVLAVLVAVLAIGTQLAVPYLKARLGLGP